MKLIFDVPVNNSYCMFHKNPILAPFQVSPKISKKCVEKMTLNILVSLFIQFHQEDAVH